MLRIAIRNNDHKKFLELSPKILHNYFFIPNMFSRFTLSNNKT